MRPLSGTIGIILTLFIVYILFMDLSPMDGVYGFSLKAQAALCVIGGFVLPAWIARRRSREGASVAPWYKNMLLALVGVVCGAILGALLFITANPISAVFNGLGFGVALGVVVVPAVTLLMRALDSNDHALWVFAYGSLMKNGWEGPFEGSRVARAILDGYHRSFNKKSTRNWGSSTYPCPTLGLEVESGAECVGWVFRFPKSQREPVMDYLRSREGPSFDLVTEPVRVEGNGVVRAVVAVNRREANTYIGAISLEKRAAMVRLAEGTDGTCADYIEIVRSVLRDTGVEDQYVEEFAEARGDVQ